MLTIYIPKEGWGTASIRGKGEISVRYVENENRYQTKFIGCNPSDYELVLTKDPHIVIYKEKGLFNG